MSILQCFVFIGTAHRQSGFCGNNVAKRIAFGNRHSHTAVRFAQMTRSICLRFTQIHLKAATFLVFWREDRKPFAVKQRKTAIWMLFDKIEWISVIQVEPVISRHGPSIKRRPVNFVLSFVADYGIDGNAVAVDRRIDHHRSTRLHRNGNRFSVIGWKRESIEQRNLWISSSSSGCGQTRDKSGYLNSNYALIPFIARICHSQRSQPILLFDDFHI